ncbi:MAG: hypothetical protein AAFU03_12320, partial [Bacteroidota bacterium]
INKYGFCFLVNTCFLPCLVDGLDFKVAVIIKAKVLWIGDKGLTTCEVHKVRINTTAVCRLPPFLLGFKQP